MGKHHATRKSAGIATTAGIDAVDKSDNAKAIPGLAATDTTEEVIAEAVNSSNKCKTSKISTAATIAADAVD